MIMLLSNPSLRSNPSLVKWLGHLATPQKIGKVRVPIWAADNGAFLGFDAPLFMAMLEKCKVFHAPVFVTAPDVVGDHTATLTLFREWEPVIRWYGYPVAFVLQDGATQADIPWSDFEALFIGGTTEFKLSNRARLIARHAKTLGKWLHMGRVNTAKRMRYAKDMDCDSCDGSGMARFFDSTVPGFVSWLEHNERQQKLIHA